MWPSVSLRPLPNVDDPFDDNYTLGHTRPLSVSFSEPRVYPRKDFPPTKKKWFQSN